MTIRKTSELGDQDLWRRAREGRPAAESVPDDKEAALLVAAYLDGSLDPAACERVEAWLAGDPAALELMTTARAGLEAGPLAPPPALLSRAQGLVRDRKPAARRSRPSRLGAWLFPDGPLWQPLGMAAMLLVVCALGFQLGRTGYASLQAEDQTAEQLMADLGFDSPSDDIF